MTDMSKTIITFGKYKGRSFDECSKDNGYCKYVLDSFKEETSGDNAKLLFKYLHGLREEKYKLNKPITGINLTDRVKSLLDNRSYEEIIHQNIPHINVDFRETCNIVSFQFIEFVKGLNAIHPSSAGCFIDYLMRHVISQQLQTPFQDKRAEITLRRCHRDTTEYFPLPFDEAYKKVIDVSNKTKDVINEILIVSMSHNFSFERIYPNEWKKQYDYLVDVTAKNDFMNDLETVLTLFKGTQYELNPTLGIKGVCADADLIVDDQLFDFKVTKSNDDKYELLQLLGYASLAVMRNVTINTIHIINFYTNVIRSINISDWTRDKRLGFLEYMHINTSLEPLENICLEHYIQSKINEPKQIGQIVFEGTIYALLFGKDSSDKNIFIEYIIVNGQRVSLKDIQYKFIASNTSIPNVTVTENKKKRITNVAQANTVMVKRAPSAYNLFIKEKMADLRLSEPGLPAKEYMTKAAALYREKKRATA